MQFTRITDNLGHPNRYKLKQYVHSNHMYQIFKLISLLLHVVKKKIIYKTAQN